MQTHHCKEALGSQGRLPVGVKTVLMTPRLPSTCGNVSMPKTCRGLELNPLNPPLLLHFLTCLQVAPLVTGLAKQHCKVSVEV